MKKVILLSLSLILGFVFKSKAQTTINSYSSYPGGTMHGTLNVHVDGNIESDTVLPDPPPGAVATDIFLSVWAETDQGDVIFITDDEAGGYADGQFDITQLSQYTFLRLHYVWEVDYSDGNFSSQSIVYN
jgi:hypothetical protein